MNASAIVPATFIDSLVDHFSFSYRIACHNLEGISNEESLIKPQPGGNTVHWVAYHIVHTRDRFLPSLGQRAVLTAPADALRLEQIVADLGESQDRLVIGLRNLTEEQLAADAPFNPRGGALGPLSQFLVKSAFHEAYHVGQFGILRRILGKPGVM